MLHLMKLELKKFSLGKYILICALAILLSMYFIFVSLYDSSAGRDTFDSVFRVIVLIFAFVFIIFFSVLNVSLIIGEYNNKTILQLFTYPFDRRKILLAKLALNTLFIACSMIIGFISCALFVIYLDASFDVIAGEFGIPVLRSWILMAVSTIYVFCALGIWTFIVGMWRKSVPMTIVSSMLFIFLRQIVISAAENYREGPFVLMMLFLLTIAGVAYTLRRNIDP